MAHNRTLAALATFACLSAFSLVSASADEVSVESSRDLTTTRRMGDAAADRNILLPSAEVGPQGELTFNSYELFLAGLSYGFTDRAQGTLTVLLPIVREMPVLVTGSFKYVLTRSENAVVSIMPTLTILQDSDSDLFVGSLGGGLLADRVLGDSGRVVLSGSLFTHLGFGEGGTDSDLQMAEGVFFYLSGALNVRLGRHVKLLTELIAPGGYTWAGSNNQFEIVEEAMLFGYGLRFFGSSIGVDLTFLRPIHPDAESDLLMGVPWVAFSGRF